MNAHPASRILLGDTLSTENFRSLIARIEDTAQSYGLYLTDEAHCGTGFVFTFSDDYMNEIGEIEVVQVDNFCGCGRSAVALRTQPDTAWLLWTQAL